jgi:hypothetical protein
LQFGLPTLLALVTVLCVVLGLWVQRAERQEFVSQLNFCGPAAK